MSKALNISSQLVLFLSHCMDALKNLRRSSLSGLLIIGEVLPSRVAYLVVPKI